MKMFWFRKALNLDEERALEKYIQECQERNISWKDYLAEDFRAGYSGLVDKDTYDILCGIEGKLGVRIFNDKVSFKVGDGASECINGDAYPCTVMKVTKTRVWVSRDNFRALKSVAYSEASTDVIASPSTLSKEEWRMYSLRKDGRYRSKGHGSFSLTFGRKYSQNPHI